MSELSELPVNQEAPEFTLLDMEGNPHNLHDYLGQIVVLNFWSAECPWSKRSDEEVLQYLHKWKAGVQYLPIASNANESQEIIRNEAAARQLPLMLHDTDQRVADLYQAITTPHIFVIDADGILRYKGAINDITFRQPEATVNYLYNAVEALLAGNSPDPLETPAYGCTIVRAAP